MTRATGRWTGCMRCAASAELEKQVYFSIADLLNPEVDLLFFDTTSTYFEVEDPMRRPHGTGVARRPAGTTRTREGGRVPDARQVQGQPRRPAADRDRPGGHPRRHPDPGLVLARQHQRLGADPAGQDRYAGLDAGELPTAGSPRRRTGGSCSKAPGLTSSGRSSGRSPRTSRRCPGRAATSKSPGTCRSRKSGSRARPTGS
jgi:hypothetical protein